MSELKNIFFTFKNIKIIFISLYCLKNNKSKRQQILRKIPINLNLFNLKKSLIKCNLVVFRLKIYKVEFKWYRTLDNILKNNYKINDKLKKMNE